MGIFKLNGIDYGVGGGGDNSMELTYAEYLALSEEEKANGTTYYITDINGDGQNFQPIIYSTDEREVGVWTDGKPLYQKTIYISSIASGGTYDISSLNVDTMVSLTGFANGSSSYSALTLPLQFANSNGTSVQLSFYYDSSDGQLRFNIGRDFSPVQNAYITLQYTKTTDTAGSGTWTPQGVPAVHYDGDEKVVGTWFNETLYEKTVTFTAPSNNYVTVATNITDFDKCIGYSGIVVFGSGIFEDINYNRPDSNNSTYYTAITATGDVFFRTYEAITGTVYITMQYIKSTS